MSPSKSPTSRREVVIIGVLIGSVCFITLTPAMYLMFHALQWTRALQIVEACFFPALLLAGIAGLLAYQRVRSRQALWQQEHPPPESPHTES
jgi:hypothetical protein